MARTSFWNIYSVEGRYQSGSDIQVPNFHDLRPKKGLLNGGLTILSHNAKNFARGPEIFFKEMLNWVFVNAKV